MHHQIYFQIDIISWNMMMYLVEITRMDCVFKYFQVIFIGLYDQRVIKWTRNS